MTAQTSGMLSLYYDLFADELQLESRLQVLDRIVGLCTDPNELLQYELLRAVTLHLHGDTDYASKLVKALEEYEKTDERQRNWYGRLQYGRVLVHLIRRDHPRSAEFFEKALAGFSEVLSKVQLNESGRAMVEEEIASLHEARQDWAKACDHWRLSLAAKDGPRAKIFLGRALQHLGRKEQAREILSGIDYDSLDESLKFDHCLTVAGDIRFDDDADAKALVERIDRLEPTYPEFQRQLDSLRGYLAKGLTQELQNTVRRLQNELEHREVTLSDRETTSALARHRSLAPTIQARTLPVGHDLETLLLEVVVAATSMLQEHWMILSRDAQSMEDTYTAFLTVLLQQRVEYLGWSVQEQSLGGSGAKNSSKERGRRDIVFSKSGNAPHGVLEAVRVSRPVASTWENIEEHIERLLHRYNPSGAAILVALTYFEGDDFSGFVKWYACATERWKDSPAKPCSALDTPADWTTNGIARAGTAIFRSIHKVASDERVVLHLVVRVPSS